VIDTVRVEYSPTFSPSAVCAASLPTRLSFHSRTTLQLEVPAFRHRLTILQRSVRRPKLAGACFLWASLAAMWRNWRSALVIVKPETVIGWHRKCRRECLDHVIVFDEAGYCWHS
jgi:hypothetical protein